MEGKLGKKIIIRILFLWFLNSREILVIYYDKFYKTKVIFFMAYYGFIKMKKNIMFTK